MNFSEETQTSKDGLEKASPRGATCGRDGTRTSVGYWKSGGVEKDTCHCGGVPPWELDSDPLAGLGFFDLAGNVLLCFINTVPVLTGLPALEKPAHPTNLDCSNYAGKRTRPQN